MTIADLTCQRLEKQHNTDLMAKKGSGTNLQMGCPTYVQSTSPNPPQLFQQDWNRTLHVAITGMIFTGPIAHGWYQVLESIVTIKHKALGLVARMILDAFIFSPIAVGGYFTVRTVLEAKPDEIVDQLYEKLSRKYWDALEASWKFWPVANIVNFSLVSVPFRVLYNNLLSIFWNTYLTHLNSQRLEHAVDARTREDFQIEHSVLDCPCVCAHCRALRG